jgi:type II secretory pathway component GspD/PulD (secretin)
LVLINPANIAIVTNKEGCNLKNYCLIVLLTLGNCLAYAEESIIEVITLYNRPASEIQPLLSPLLDGTDQVRADGANLLIKTTPERLANIQDLVKQLDVRQNNFLITVVQSRQTSAADLNAALRAKLAMQNNRLGDSNIEMMGHIYQTQDSEANESTQQLRTLEGAPAVIKIGKVYPVQNAQVYQNGYGNMAVTTNTQMVEASTGFVVTPRLTGQQVTLDVAPWSDAMNGRGQIETQSAQSTLRVNLGEWVELGGINETESYNSTGAPSRIRQTNDNQMHILVKVDKAN